MSANDPRLADQIRYYRHRAPEYDVTSYADFDTIGTRLDRVLDQLSPGGRTLEIACGTGLWTKHLAARASTLLAVDAAPEALALARTRAPSAHFAIADAFALPVRTEFDTVFFAAWLSHVPTDLLATFWSQLDGIARRVLFMDEPPSSNHEKFVEPEIVTRTTNDGAVHRAVKVFWHPERLEAALRQLGWRATVTEDDGWLIGESRPLGC